MSEQNDKRVEKKSNGKSASVASGYDAPFRGFVNLNLSDADKKDFDAWYVTGGFWELLDTYAADGVHFAVKWSDKERTFVGSGTQRRAGSPNAGLVVTTRSVSAGKALARCVYSVMLLSAKERWEFTQPASDPDRW